MARLSKKQLLSSIVHYARVAERQRILQEYRSPQFDSTQFSVAVDILFDLIEQLGGVIGKNGDSFMDEDIAMIAWGRSLEYWKAGANDKLLFPIHQERTQAKGPGGTQEAQATKTRTAQVRTTISRNKVGAT